MSNWDSIKKAVKKAREGGGGGKDDHQYYYPERDKAGNGYAVIRFLPQRDDDELPWVKIFNHAFKGPNGKWLIEKCPTTIDNSCPVCESNSDLWNSGVEANKEIVRKERKRKLSYVANILVISDPKTPENEGKVFLFKFGSKIFDKIVDTLDPQVVEGEPIVEPVNVFDLKEGCNFKLRIRVVDKQTNYDKSEFDSVSEVEGDVDEIMGQVTELKEFVDPKTFKSYDEINTRLNLVLGLNKSVPKEEAPSKTEKVKEDSDVDVDADDDDIEYFKNLAKSSDD